jgi:16S rRNA (uracil1498-N3)-methyltransferase
MRHLFLPAQQITGETATISGPDHAHLARVLRIRPGETLTLLDNAGNAYHAIALEVGKTTTTARLVAQITLRSEPPIRVTVAQALGKGDRFEQVIQHGTELGAAAFIPVLAERCVAEVKAEKEERRLTRWRLIAKGAAEQSGRLYIPEVLPPRRFGDLLRALPAGPTLLLHPDARESLRAFLATQPHPADLTLIVGPEGGWSQAEVSSAQAANVIPIRLGPRILRTETAALVALSQIVSVWETE